MVSLKTVQTRFDVTFTVIEGGSGQFQGVIGETEQNSQPNYIFSTPRRVLRVKTPGLVKPGIAVRTPSNEIYLVGDNGPSETSRGVLWESFRLFHANFQVNWKRRKKIIDPVTTLERDDGVEDMGTVWAVLEEIDREVPDRKLGASFELSRFLTAADVRADDLIDNRTVTRSDVQLGLRVGTLT